MSDTMCIFYVKDGATFEAALDWLCLNLPSHELPVKFSTGASRFPSTGMHKIAHT